jgi:hypothetical protein
MIDYYSLIVKAVTNLQSRQARRAVYERGRNAFIAELKAVTPSLSQSIITKEMLAFETGLVRRRLKWRAALQRRNKIRPCPH